ncbi:MAG: IclR family transcriptional regulator, regulon repressor [Candidatus Eremiobacteraeota bacterium]|nr:IclR family transcriptional regulator, regulon repressor [Candidatus Eremiobacteraeota bacterium]
MTAEPSTGFDALQSVGRVLDVLEAFGDAGEHDLGVSECALAVGVNKSTVYRILATLEQRGYARQDAQTGRYALTASWWRIARATAGAGSVIELAAAPMRALRDKTRETVQLAVYGGKGVATYVNVVEGTHPVRSVSPLGMRFPATATSTGKALLAMQPDAERDRVARKLRRYTDTTIADRRTFARHLETIRRDGYAVNRGEYRSDVCGVAIPIRGADGSTIAALGFCVPRFRFETLPLDALLALLRRARAEIERGLGSPGETP